MAEQTYEMDKHLIEFLNYYTVDLTYTEATKDQFMFSLFSIFNKYRNSAHDAEKVILGVAMEYQLDRLNRSLQHEERTNTTGANRLSAIDFT
jgi:hypothetical protein